MSDSTATPSRTAASQKSASPSTDRPAHYNQPQFAAASRSRQHVPLANQAPRCVHVKPNGLRCGSPALRGQPWCHFHHAYYNAPWEDTFPPLEDGNGVQSALMYVLERLRREAFRGGEVNVPVAKALLYGLQTASYNLRHTNFDPVIEAVVTCDALSLDKDLGSDTASASLEKKSAASATE